MPNIVKKEFLNDLEKRFGQFKKLPKSLSLFELEEANVRIYIRYSKIHPRNQTFYGLRQEDLKKLLHQTVNGFTVLVNVRNLIMSYNK